MASLGLTVQSIRAGWFGGARVRYLGEAPLIEDNSVRSEPTTLVNLEVGYRVNDSVEVSARRFQPVRRRCNDITYFYESRLPGEREPVEDIHFHPVEPRTFRGTVTWRF